MIKFIVAVAAAFLLFVVYTEFHPNYVSSKYIGKVQSTRYVSGGFNSPNGYAVTIDDVEYFTEIQLYSGQDVFLVVKEFETAPEIYGWDPLAEVKE